MRNMKFIVLLFLISGCGMSDLYNLVGHRRFKVGDCLIQSTNPPESWDKPRYVVLELGVNSYRVEDFVFGYTGDIFYGHMSEDFYQVVSC